MCVSAPGSQRCGQAQGQHAVRDEARHLPWTWLRKGAAALAIQHLLRMRLRLRCLPRPEPVGGWLPL